MHIHAGLSFTDIGHYVAL